ncbi:MULTISPECIES: TetR/AcrR family transcriptional regulator [Protofrankia]|uniref:Regulatory protein TetR n=2 Tax=Candidatus Protofrankia datiscae TaxID=2716812 RepID=F8B3T7_9ACTN|nr:MULTISPECIES: TetR/AcrR family transcriptional regulator [Protofrankia]AEH09032.1 regulatory protein TetR [Candidatus Protofrankia datiscae]
MTEDGPRRQARGIRRIASILDAAAALFTAAGYDATTTNAIASAAKISPGSLYQFFPNKPAIAEALTARYVDDLNAIYDHALAIGPGDPAATSKMIDQLVAALVAFHVANPAAKALLSGASVAPDLAMITAPLHSAMCDRAEEIVAAIAPTLTPREQARTAEVCIHIVQALMPMILAAPAASRHEASNELKRALVGYLLTPP